MTKRKLDIRTRVVHAGERKDPPRGRPVATPVYASATFTYERMAEADEVFAGEKPGYVYSRYGNPTVDALAEAVCALEGGAAACAYASGMAALHAALLACELGAGTTILAAKDLYGATVNLLEKIFGMFDVRTVMCDFCDVEALEAKAREVRPRVLLAETISNPLLKVCDLARCAQIAHAIGAKLVIDNTFATPYLCRPLEHGADLVVHSATKYLGGHADVMGGVVVVRDAPEQAALISVMKLAGAILGPWEAHEILRGLKTLAVRMERQCANAAHIAQQLAGDSRMARVYYPALSDRQTIAGPTLVDEDATYRRMLGAPHAGAIVTFELQAGTQEAAFAFMDALRVCVRSSSLGDVFTGVLHPASSSHRELSPAQRKQLGITAGMVRISVGIEDVDDVLADIRQALDASTAVSRRAS